MICMKKIKIDYLSQEAYVILSDGNIDILVFSHPFEGEIELPLMGFACYDINKSDKKKYYVEKLLDSYFGYKINGKLIDKEKGIVKLGEFTIELDDKESIPQDIKNGDFIQFKVVRIDM